MSFGQKVGKSVLRVRLISLSEMTTKTQIHFLISYMVVIVRVGVR